MITFEDLRKELKNQQLNISDFLILAIMEMVEPIEACMESHGYSDAKKLMIVLYLCQLHALMSSDARITSQTAPSGASRSMKVLTVGERFKMLKNQIELMDPFGCSSGLIPANPDASPAGLWVSPGTQPGFCG